MSPLFGVAPTKTDAERIAMLEQDVRELPVHVAPGHAHGEGRRRPRGVPVLLSVSLVISLGNAKFVASAAGPAPLDYGTRWEAYAAARWLTLNTILVAAAR